MNVTFLGATGNSIYSVDLNVTEDYYRELKSLLKIFHSLIQPKGLYEMGGMISFLKKINLTHSLVHLHGNNHGIFLKFGDFVCPDILELTYVKNSNYKLADDENISLPIPEDAPNNPRAVDIPLGFWNRVSVN